MTIEQTKALILNKDYVVFNQNIYKFLFLEEKNFGSLSIEFVFLEINNEPVKVPPPLCFTLDEYRGCFDSRALPPRPEKENTSIDVISWNEHRGMEIVYYNFDKSNWYEINGEQIFDNFKWCFKPNYLSYEQ